MSCRMRLLADNQIIHADITANRDTVNNELKFPVF